MSYVLCTLIGFRQWLLTNHTSDYLAMFEGEVNVMFHVLFLLPRTLKSLNSIEKIQPRIMVATFNGNPGTTIISSYSPTNTSDETDLDTFYNELSTLVRSVLKYNVLIIGGDMNAQIGKNVNNKFSLHK